MRLCTKQKARRLLAGSHSRQRGGFTLVELLTVIAIIGVLVGLIVPAVMIGLRSVKKAAIAMEVTTLADAVEKYQQKYGDYPPDGSNASVMTRHVRKIFPQIANTEVQLIISTVGGVPIANFGNGAPPGVGVMDPPEALVFFLGGFSDDPVYPFSGSGGPIFLSNSGTQVNSSQLGNSTIAQYNVDRTGALYEFNQAQLTIEVVQGIARSIDEATLLGGTAASNDLMPVYHPKGMVSPFVYFDSRTYSSGGFYNNYTSNAIGGAARPYRSDEVRTTTPISNPDQHFRYMNEDSFQLMSAGLDDLYGGIPFTSGSGPVFYRFPSGDSLDFGQTPPIVGATTRYIDNNGISYQADNATNFSAGVLENSLEN
jgi:prepilin-type N-terminal cleavage/methylation domain-containing protein